MIECNDSSYIASIKCRKHVMLNFYRIHANKNESGHCYVNPNSIASAALLSL